MKKILDIQVVEDDDGIYLAFSQEPDILTQADNIKEAIENYAILYEIERNPKFGTEIFGAEED